MPKIRRRQIASDTPKAANTNRIVDNVNKMVDAQSVNPKRWCLITASERRIILRALSLLRHSSTAVTDLCINNQPEVDALNKSIFEIMHKFAEEHWMEQFINDLPADIKVPGKRAVKE